MWLKTAIAVTQQHAYAVSGHSVIRSGEIGVPVCIEVRDSHRVRTIGSRVVDVRLEGAISVTDEHADGAAKCATGRGHHQIEFVVVVEVAHRYRTGAIVDGIGHLRLESTVAVTQRHAQKDVGGFGDHEIAFAFPVKVAGGDAVGIGAHTVIHRRLESCSGSRQTSDKEVEQDCDGGVSEHAFLLRSTASFSSCK